MVGLSLSKLTFPKLLPAGLKNRANPNLTYPKGEKQSPTIASTCTKKVTE